MIIMKRRLFYFLLSILLWLIKLISPKYSTEQIKFAGIGHRVEILKKLCADKFVFHVGFADAPNTEDKIRTNSLLHLQLKGVVEGIYGIDVSRDAVEIYRKLTGDYGNSVKDIRELTADDVRDYDIILLGEVIEHIEDPMKVLRKLREFGKVIIITVPNARRFLGFLHAVQGKLFESEDHIFAYSYTTFSNLLRRAGLQIKEVYATSYRNYESIIRFLRKYPMLCESFIFVIG